MSERESWMPSDEELLDLLGKAQHHYDGPAYSSESVKILRALIRTAVEKALAEEWKKSLDAKEELIRRFRELQTEQEARHKREVIEARLEELIDYGECTCVTLGGTCAAHVHENELRAELAALEVKP